MEHLVYLSFKYFIICVKAARDAMPVQALGAKLEPVQVADGTAAVARAAGDTAAAVQAVGDTAVVAQVAGDTAVAVQVAGAEEVVDAVPALPAAFPGNYLQDAVQVH